jgi:hypothetical protein
MASAVLDAIEARASVDRSGWSAAERSARLLEIFAAQERLAAMAQQEVGEWDRDRAWALDDALTPVSWLLHRVPMTRQDAMVLVRTARHVVAHEATAKALDVGDISPAHTTMIGRAVRHRESLYAEHEDVILEAARTLPPTAFRDAMQHWAACADDVLGRGGGEGELDGNYLDLATTFGGVGHVEGRLDPLSLATLMRLAGGDKAPEVDVDAIVDVDTMAGRMPTDLTTASCELEGIGFISPALMSLYLCDCSIGRVLMQGKSEVLDLGRRTRLITPALRRALRVRDRTCVEPGCTLPGIYCDGHHKIHWTEHGETNLANLELRCRRHHLLQHRRDLQAAGTRRRE